MKVTVRLLDLALGPDGISQPAYGANINADLTHSVMGPEDLTLKQLTDIGWFSDNDGVPDGEDQCIGSDASLTVVIDGCDSGVANTVFPTGCTMSDKIKEFAAGAADHGEFVDRVSQSCDQLILQGVITGKQKGAIMKCAARSSIGK